MTVVNIAESLLSAQALCRLSTLVCGHGHVPSSEGGAASTGDIARGPLLPVAPLAINADLLDAGLLLAALQLRQGTRLAVVSTVLGRRDGPSSTALSRSAGDTALAPCAPVRHLAGPDAARNALVTRSAFCHGAVAAFSSRGSELQDLSLSLLLADTTRDRAAAPLRPLRLLTVLRGTVAQVASGGLDHLAGAKLTTISGKGYDLPLSLQLTCTAAAVTIAPLHPIRDLAVDLCQVA